MDYQEYRRQREEYIVKDVMRGRELFALEALGVRVQGTCHLPGDEASGAQARRHDLKGTGILLISGLLSPRAAIGDSAVFWADSFAKRGYTCFRVDLPGSCDSGGDAPPELLSFINTGGYEVVTVEVIKQIVARYNLSSVILMGHCSGTVTALFAAAAYKDCRGLVLLEPYFHLPPPVATKTREALSDWAASNRLGGVLSNLFDRLKALRLRLRLRSSELPGNANLPLLDRWKSLASAGLPILVLKAPSPKASGSKPRLGDFDYLNYVIHLGGTRSRVDLRVIEGAGHSFADRTGRAVVRNFTEDWLGQYFPAEKTETPLLPVQDLQSIEINPVTLAAAVPAYVSSGERIGAL
jgi:pimeloyl-ACP methyl ester carboxylesterase